VNGLVVFYKSCVKQFSKTLNIKHGIEALHSRTIITLVSKFVLDAMQMNINVNEGGFVYFVAGRKIF